MRPILWILLFIIYLLGIFVLYHVPTERAVEEEGMIYFYSCQEYDCAKILLDLTDSYEEVYCAFYDLDEPRLLDHFRDDDRNLLLYLDNNDYDLGTSIKIDGLMHHKFCVFDEQLTLTGSWNPTMRGTEDNDNYITIIESKSIAKKFLEEHRRLSENERTGTSGIEVNLSGTDVKVCFSPHNNCEEMIEEGIRKAKETIDVLAFSFTNDGITKELLEARKRNVSVRVVFEKTRISKYSQYNYLNVSGIESYLDGNRYTMHEKMFIIDNTTAFIGSYNPSTSADERNDENLVMIKDDMTIDDMESEFQRIMREAELT